MEIPETVVIQMQNRIWELKDEYEAYKLATREALTEYKRAQNAEEYALQKLREMAEFLNEVCHIDADSDDNYLKEVGLLK